jgi:hypothetical protein
VTPTSAGERAPGQARARAARLLPLLPLLAGLGLWLASLPSVDIDRLGQYGLLGSLPLTWYAALGVLVAGGAAVTAVGRPSGWIMAAYVAAVVAVLWATIPAVADAPQYPWVYKHIGVTQLIEAHGGLAANADIYNRWPGFFALAAVFSRLAGLPDPVSYAAWAEPLFMAVDALLVAAIAQTLTRQLRVAGAAALLYVLLNWVGQTYFSPQAAASTLALALLLVVLRGLPRPAPSRWSRAGEPPLSDGLGWPPAAVAAVVLALDLAIVVTHQLTPFALVAQVGALTLLGAAGSWRLVAAMVLLPGLFLVANLGYVQEHFTLLTGLDPLQNLRSAGTYDVERSAGKVLNADVSLLLSAGMFAAALLSAFVLRRRGFALVPVVLLALAFAPFAVVLLQSYGGEASLRVILYAAPWAAVLVAAAVATAARPRLRVALSVGVALATCALAVPAVYGVSQLNVIPRSTVAISEDFYARAPAGSVLMLAGPGFPLRVGARYDLFRGPIGDADPNLLHDDTFRSRALGLSDLPAVIREIRRYSPRGYLAFSDTEQRWAQAFGLTAPGALSDLERAVASSLDFHLWSSSPTARIYELTSAGG